MYDNRKANRWHPVDNFKSSFTYDGINDEVEVLDISAMGMRAFFSKPVSVGAQVKGKLDIPYNRIPFFITGKVVRVRESSSAWEASIKFSTITTTPSQ